ncbi:MAG: gliding motility protein [Archangium gephyra]|uniref:Gliding motility protein n=1 Tax=Archangium gephyra TaxID=48 RepID=A0A2W5V4Y5_9BACT|nr:MAG: gliding motility protein [Archangium gephyra]
MIIRSEDNTMRRVLMSAAVAVGLLTTGCTTTQSNTVKDDSKTASNTAGTGGADQPQISNKAKLLFDDALKSWDTQKKAKNVDYPSIEKKFKAAADADPNLAEAVYNLGVLAERQGKTKEAVAFYKDALSRKPTLKQAAENLGVIAQNNGDEATAQKVYTDLLTSYPDDASSRARLAELARRRGDGDRAIELSREALFRDPKTLQAFKTMMLVYTERKQYALARLIALRASKIDDSDPEIFYTLGTINLAEKDPSKARAQFKRAVEVRPDYLPAQYQLARMAFDQEDYQGAEEHLRRILQANGKNTDALVNLGVAYKGMGQLDKAMATYDEAAKLNPEMPELLLNKGIIIGLKGDPEKAITLYKSYIARKGDVGLSVDHPVHKLIEEQEEVIKQREEEKRIAAEAARMEEEMKKQEAAAAEEEKKKKEEEFQKTKAEAKGQGAPAPSPAPAPAAKDEPKKEEPKKAPAPAPAPAKKTPSGDEPEDGL